MSVSLLLAGGAAVGVLYALGQGVVRLFAGATVGNGPRDRSGTVPIKGQRLVFGGALLWFFGPCSGRHGHGARIGRPSAPLPRLFCGALLRFLNRTSKNGQ